MPEPSIVILSNDKDFAQPLAEQLQRELGFSCQVTADAGEAGSASLVVANGAVKQQLSCKLLVTGKPPFRMQTLLDQAAALLQEREKETLDLGRGYVLKLRQKQLSLGKDTVSLTDKEMQLLQSLLQAGKRGAAKDKLLKDVWGFETELDTHTLETHVYRLRGKFKELSGDDSVIAAVENGYALAMK